MLQHFLLASTGSGEKSVVIQIGISLLIICCFQLLLRFFPLVFSFQKFNNDVLTWVSLGKQSYLGLAPLLDSAGLCLSLSQVGSSLFLDARSPSLSFCFSASPLLGKSQTFPSTNKTQGTGREKLCELFPRLLVETPARRKGRPCPVEPCPMEQKLTNHPSIRRPIPSSTS